MELKYFVVLSLLLGATMATESEDSPDCGEAGASACMDTLLERTLSDSSTADVVCPALYEASQCLRDTVQNCLGDERDRDVDEALDEMDSEIRKQCPENDGVTEATDVEDSPDCGEARVSACIDTLLEKALSDSTTEDDMCPALYETSQCLRDTVQNCLGNERDSDMDEALDEMDSEIRKKCPVTDEESNDSVSDEDEECVKENEDYIRSCISDTALEVAEMPNLDSNALICSVYNLSAECLYERIREKCGAELGELVKKEMEDMPEEIQVACSQDTVDFYSISLLDKRKRRK